MAPGIGESVSEVRMESATTAIFVGLIDILGVLDGDMVGKNVNVGGDDGDFVGLIDKLGVLDGDMVGKNVNVGGDDGDFVGLKLGNEEGSALGIDLGCGEGLFVGQFVGSRLIEGAVEIVG